MYRVVPKMKSEFPMYDLQIHVLYVFSWFQCLPYTWYDLQLLHVVFLFLNVVMWFCLFHASTTDPGYLPRNIPEYDMAIKQVYTHHKIKCTLNTLHTSLILLIRYLG